MFLILGGENGSHCDASVERNFSALSFLRRGASLGIQPLPFQILERSLKRYMSGAMPSTGDGVSSYSLTSTSSLLKLAFGFSYFSNWFLDLLFPCNFADIKKCKFIDKCASVAFSSKDYFHFLKKYTAGFHMWNKSYLLGRGKFIKSLFAIICLNLYVFWNHRERVQSFFLPWDYKN